MSPLGGRPLGFVAREAVRPANWSALARMPRRYPHFAEKAWRYFTGRGEYPYRCEVRTPQGIVAPTLFSADDMVTMNEVFCREDYRAGPDLEVVVDIGSNIGISALYFLTRSAAARVWLCEPVPANVERLRANLAGFDGRWSLDQAAVADRDGEARFAVEPSGRYGGLEAEHAESIQVPVRHIDSVLREVLERESRIGVLKIDTEGSEARTLDAASRELLARVDRIYLEDTDRAVAGVPGFDQFRRASVLRLVNQEAAPAYTSS
jgi:FkbM family methyltransferase